MATAVVPLKMFGDSEFSLSGDYLVYWRDFAFSKGVSASTLLEGSGIPVNMLLNPPDRIAHANMYPVSVNLLNVLGDCYQTAVELGQFLEERKHGLLGLAVQGANNLLDASKILVQYILTRTSVQNVEVVPSEQYYRLRFQNNAEHKFESAPEVMVLYELSTLVSIEAILRRMLEGHILSGASRMNFTVPAPELVPDYLSHSDSVIMFEQPFMELCIPVSWMELPFQAADEELGQAATKLCESELRNLQPKDIVERLLDKIQQVEGAKPSLEEMAAEMFMSASTLQRRLKDQGMTYQKIKSVARLRQAQNLLVNSNIPLDDIASTLGFSDASNFSKSFKTWTGLTPIAFRNQHNECLPPS
ncbi:AraC family transcriptional regulator [Parendozoicomonas sp. Alg238-R29]|uniref:AraC family transcriptional regulator n=1 Tax=Parendozoicomonas sp. Alg238-R29 TaxID=2993446 RepID=UPI00248EF515|nr:AraC family transcriptional regulator [Parendozoicomonas sp. Alg238-R29]